MDANLKTKWVDALRSGKYRQTAGMLRFDETEEISLFCCLGVLCDVAGVEWIDGHPFLGGVTMEDDEESYLSNGGLKIVQLPDDTQRTLAQLNDDGKPFAEIADYIEANL